MAGKVTADTTALMPLSNLPLIKTAPRDQNGPENPDDRFPDCVAVQAEGRYVDPKTVVVRAGIQFGLHDPRPNVGPLRIGVKAGRLIVTANGEDFRHGGSAGQQMAQAVAREVSTQGGQEISRTDKSGGNLSVVLAEKPSIMGGASGKSARSRKVTASTSTATQYDAFQLRPIFKPFGWEFRNQKPDVPYLSDTLLDGLEISFSTSEEDLRITVSFTIRESDLYLEGTSFRAKSLMKTKLTRRLFYRKYICQICDDYLSRVILCHVE